MSRSLLAHYTFQERPAWTSGPRNVAHDDTLEFNLLVSGYEHVINDGSREQIFSRGKYEVLEPFREHSSWTERQGAVFHNVHLFADQLAELADSVSIKRLSWPTRSQAAPASLRRLLEAFRRESAHGAGVPGHALVMEALAVQLGVTLLRAHHGASARARSQVKARGTEAKLGRTAERMREDPGASFSLEQLASEAGMSRFHFLRSFKKAFGLTPHAFLAARRLEQAARLLREGEQSITEIALSTGFGSSSQFSTRFKRHFGVSPSLWREEKR